MGVPRRLVISFALLSCGFAISCGQLIGATDHEPYPGAGAGGGDSGAGAAVSAGAGNDSGAAAADAADGGGAAGAADAAAGATGAGGNTSPSCTGAPADRTCGAGRDEDCCASTLVEGGTFERPVAGILTTVSDFRLDRFEVTVGRFRAFVAAVMNGYLPQREAGKHTHLDPSADARDPGWQEAWNVHLPREAREWDDVGHLSCSGASWTPAPRDKETLPIVCVNWFQAYAFCIYDGGFLPSVAELLYAAAGGNAQYAYPWGNDPVTHERAVYAPDELSVAGSRSAGKGRWGHADLVGNAWEWAADLESFWSVLCTRDCLDVPPDPDRSFAVGGSFAQSADGVGSDAVFAVAVTDRAGSVGFRCARSP